MESHVFLVGPGGVGKTSSGSFLANLLAREFIDLDEQFMTNVGHIGNYIGQNGYAAYVRQNSELFFRQMESTSSPHVVALSSGFLIPETEVNTVMRNRQAVKDCGHSIVPLPHGEPEVCATIVTNRQVQRGFGLKPEIERPKFLERLEIYKHLADQVVLYRGRPEDAAQEMFAKLRMR